MADNLEQQQSTQTPAQDFSLDDFTDTASYSIEDFQDVDAIGETPPPATSLASNRSRATTTALLNSNDPQQQIATYQAINTELVNQGTSPTMKQVTDKYVVEEQNAYRRATADFLANPAVSDEWKAQAIQNINDKENPLYNPRGLLATKEASQPVQGRQRKRQIYAEYGRQVWGMSSSISANNRNSSTLCSRKTQRVQLLML